MKATGPLRAIGVRRVLRWLARYAALCAVCGALAGAFWEGVVRLPTYEVRVDGQATIGERGLAAFFATDAWFVIVGLLVGLGLGYLAWRWFRPLGWLLPVLAAAGALLAALVCWGTGVLLGPGPLSARLADASPGDRLPIAFELSALPALAAWPFAAMLPILVLASFLPDPEDPAPAAARA